MTPEIGAPVAHDVIVPETVPHAAAGVHEGNLYAAMRVDQLNAPLVF